MPGAFMSGTAGRLTGLLAGILAGIASLTALPQGSVALGQAADERLLVLIDNRYGAVEDAVREGIIAYRSGNFDKAIAALEYAAERNQFLAQYYLARIYANNATSHTDHPKAYMLYTQIARDYADADADDPRAPFVAKSLTALASYMRFGLPEIGVHINRRRAAEYLNHAALFFNDPDAQFELAKMQIEEASGPDDHRAKQGLDWLSALARRRHPGAQAFLADLINRGKLTHRDPTQALALIIVSSRNAPVEEQVWIDDILQNIYCGAPQGVRKQANGLVADWNARYGRRPKPPAKWERDVLEPLEAKPVRACANGEVLPDFREMSLQEIEKTLQRSGMLVDGSAAAERSGFMRGSADTVRQVNQKR
jgi:hypothetical protein